MEKGIAYARTAEGLELAVIDVTNPAFALNLSEEQLAELLRQFLIENSQPRDLSPEVIAALKASILGSALMAASGTFLDAISTYRLKLGPAHLGEGATQVDLKIASSFPAVSARLRNADMARLLAEGLATRGHAAKKDLRFFNLGGGTAADSWNALILLTKDHPETLRDRKIQIAVLDLDQRGPAFAANAIAALRQPGNALAGLEIALEFVSYEWSETERLRSILEAFAAKSAVCAISSEGALFEYGTDDEIVANLSVLREGVSNDAFVVGSATRDAEATRAISRAGRIATRPRTLESFETLAMRGGWQIEKVLERAFSFHVRLATA
ncbi:MAG TPA: hypothetical protein VJN93_12875 [Candidatus Acidoferrum sp.]|nr:hypothetical protein [Candidatus Acidoferrum sp.]